MCVDVCLIDFLRLNGMLSKAKCKLFIFLSLSLIEKENWAYNFSHFYLPKPQRNEGKLVALCNEWKESAAKETFLKQTESSQKQKQIWES